MSKYKLTFVNHSTNVGDVCVYQNDPDLGVHNVMSLAWFAKRAAPETIVTFTWEINYSFVWSETGQIKPGLLFEASQVKDADLEVNNQVRLKYPDGYYTFSDIENGPEAGSLYIKQGPGIPMKQASVGIGMSGAPVFAVQAQSNINLMFTPHPNYWITFGSFESGQVLDLEAISDCKQVTFQDNCFEMAAILKGDNSWRIEPTSEALK